jgi:hypothetical protein
VKKKNRLQRLRFLSIELDFDQWKLINRSSSIFSHNFYAKCIYVFLSMGKQLLLGNRISWNLQNHSESIESHRIRRISGIQAKSSSFRKAKLPRKNIADSRPAAKSSGIIRILCNQKNESRNHRISCFLFDFYHILCDYYTMTVIESIIIIILILFWLVRQNDAIEYNVNVTRQLDNNDDKCIM